MLSLSIRDLAPDVALSDENDRRRLWMQEDASGDLSGGNTSVWSDSGGGGSMQVG